MADKATPPAQPDDQDFANSENRSADREREALPKRAEPDFAIAARKIKITGRPGGLRKIKTKRGGDKTMPRSSKPCQDHMGKTWPSEATMCQHYNIPVSTYHERRSRGWNLEQALTTTRTGQGPKIKPRKDIIKDHLGQEFISIAEMCRHWGLSTKVYWSRKRICKWPLDKILTEPVRDPKDTTNKKPVTDHTGRTFDSTSALCRHWKIGLSTYRERIRRGWDIETALTKQETKIKTDHITCRDHTGQEFQSKNAMCTKWGITRYCFDARIALGWTLEQALTERTIINAKSCRDHTGKLFPATQYMSLYLGFPKYALQSRPNHGNKDPDYLTRLIPDLAEKYWTGRVCNGYLIKSCIEFPWFLVEHRHEPLVLHFDQILDMYHRSNDFWPLPESKLENPSVYAVRQIQWPYYLAMIYGQSYAVHYDDLLSAHMDSNFGLSPGPINQTQNQNLKSKAGENK